MGFVTITVMAVGLAMDAFAVSVVSGATYKRLHVRHALRMAGFFGGFQAVMPLIGYMAGMTVREYASAWDHWIAFGLLAGVGGKMIYESFKIEEAEKHRNPANIIVLLILSVATSIDALAIGVTLSMVANAVVAAAIIIGVITFGLSLAGVYIGKRFGHFFENKIEIAGGLILIGIGVKIVLEHTLS